MKLFQFAIILHPTPKEAEQGKASQLIVEVTTILAKDPSMAAMLAGRAIPQEHLDKLDRLEVAVRPF
jgi:hypothetical protein